MRICLIVPRYGPEILGGAEKHIREYAEHLAAAGHGVRVLTTCARNRWTWENELPPGPTRIAGIEVLRFPLSPRGRPGGAASLQAALELGLALTPADELEWLRFNGHSEQLMSEIDRVADSVDVMLFAPYLAATTVFGAARRPERSLVMPCLHDEPQARFGAVRQVLSSVRGLIFNTEEERDLARGVLGSLPPNEVVGAGMALGVAPNRPARPGGSAGAIAYAGRTDRAKGFPLLVRWVTAYNLGLGRPPPLSLDWMGGGPFEMPAAARAWVRKLGYLREEEKLRVLSGAAAVVNLSTSESFSYLLMEAWLCGVPVIVHADCPVTRGHCARSGGGVWVAGPEEFAAAVDRLRADPAVGRRLGEAGRRYVADRYAWPAVMDRLQRALDRLAA